MGSPNSELTIAQWDKRMEMHRKRIQHEKEEELARQAIMLSGKRNKKMMHAIKNNTKLDNWR